MDIWNRLRRAAAKSGDSMKKLVSAVDPITKYVFDNGLEFSLIRRDTKTVVVVPTQSGCKMGCTFCFLTARKNQEIRNLPGKEIADGVGYILAGEPSTPEKDLLISFMSSGEPLSNIEGIRNTIRYYLQHAKLLERDGTNWFKRTRFGVASIIPSVKQGMEFVEAISGAQEQHIGLSVKLHYSMHATTDETRKKLIPRATTISSGLSILDIYRKLGQPTEIHYTPIAGINDTDEDLKRLADLDHHVKLMRFRAGMDAELQPSNEERVKEMLAVCKSGEIYSPPGQDINANCGAFEVSQEVAERLRQNA